MHIFSIKEKDGSSEVRYLMDGVSEQIHTESGSLSQPYQYVGEEGYYTEEDTGLKLLGQRWYDGGVGRFISKDPIGEEGGLNLYAYVGNNCVNYTDTYGEFIGSWVIWGDKWREIWRITGECVKEIMDAVIQIYIRNSLNFPGVTVNDKREHCVRSCRIAEKCGSSISNFLGLMKETIDQVQTNFHIKVDPASVEDFLSNIEGRQWANTEESCECCCENHGY